MGAIQVAAGSRWEVIGTEQRSFWTLMGEKKQSPSLRVMEEC